MLYELIRTELLIEPAPVTFDAPTYAAVVGAVYTLNRFYYAIPIDHNGDAMPCLGPLLIPEGWLIGRFGQDYETFMKTNQQDICDTLRTFMTGTAEDRRAHFQTLEELPDDEARKAFIEQWDDPVHKATNELADVLPGRIEEYFRTIPMPDGPPQLKGWRWWRWLRSLWR